MHILYIFFISDCHTAGKNDKAEATPTVDKHSHAWQATGALMDNIQSAAARLNRRTFLKASTVGATLLFGGGAAFLLQGCALPAQPSPGAPTITGSATTFAPDVEITLTAGKGKVQILPGAATATWGYRGEVIQGDAAALQAIPDSYLGPILRLRKGQKVRINLKNELDEETIIHWHGLITPPAMDGHPQDAIGPGETYVYEFEVKNRAGTYWFHPHPHGRTAYQAYMGMAGLFLISDDEEVAVGLPGAEFDLPLVIQDRTFDADNQLLYLTGAMGQMTGRQGMNHGVGAAQEPMPMQEIMGFLGERILVNGHPDFVLPVATRTYRLRLLNGSNSRIYKLAWSNGAPLTVIATDGGLLEQPVQRDYITLSPGERVELWADFRQLAVGDEVKLLSLAYTGVEAGMFMGGMMMEMVHTATLPNGAPFDVLTVRVERGAPNGLPETLSLPAQLASMKRLRAEDALNGAQPRLFALGMAGGNWLINRRSFIMDEVSEDEHVALGSMEVWEFINELNTAGLVLGSQGHLAHAQAGPMSGMSMQGDAVDFMAHPMHIHGVQFQVLSRQIDPAFEQDWHTLSAGFVDEGWKDTVLVMPGERVRIGLRFADYAGRYLLHCHNLEHESLGMMRNFLIT
jgi:FtsP/CotA-like multicopper oxidase with cupredoxin domain